jgi:hypothetical protein
VLALVVLAVPLSTLAAECRPPTTWSDYIKLSCQISTEVLVGKVRAQTQDSPGAPFLCYELEPSRVFRGTLRPSERLAFCAQAPAPRDSVQTRDPDPMPEIGESWLIFAMRIPPGPQMVPNGAPVAVMAVRVDVDSVWATPLSPILPSALLDTVSAVMSRCGLSKADSTRMGWQ